VYWGPIQDKRKRYVKKINWLSAALAFTADVAMLMLGGALKRKENISGRLGDILSQLYLASATIKFYGEHEPSEDEWLLAQWALEHSLYEAQEAFYALLHNFPSRFVGILLQGIIFPYGRAFTAPKDALSKKVARLILTPSPVREKLSTLCYLSKEGADPTATLDRAFAEYIQAQPGIDKISQAVKNKIIKKHIGFGEKIQQALAEDIIDQAEAEQLFAFETLRQKVIAVDEFSANLL
jgi:hypothetical protein